MLKSQSTYDFLTSAKTPIWLVQGIIPAASITFVSGIPGAGKTFFALEMALACATGTEFMGRFPCEELRVLFIEEDSPDWDLAAQLRKVMAGRNLAPVKIDNDLLFLVKRGANLNTDEGASAIADLIEYTMVPLVIIDNLRDIHDLDEDKSFLMKQITKRLDYIRTRTGAALIVLHHPRKGSKGSDPLNDLRGSGGLGGKVDGVLGLRYLKRSDQFQVVVGKRRAMLMQDWNYRLTITEDTAIFDCKQELDDVEAAVLAAVGEETTAKEIVDTVALAIPDLAHVEKRVHDGIARLRSMSLIHRVRRGVYEKLDISSLDTSSES